ncbi:hypothetical protein [Pyxidicoccus sp. MSG2]|uniref:hypothetical protein n=1 Tax=Pyxidicoccus sp. MSG2 TaxID=2996790 RepID=UPI00226F2B6D|nr:hypothetical protein [Pyxidicoccus sp. MSG2]MCY1020682.1 hypothetical protein [Pyxidicoccus sp. MSG2]
MSRCLFRGAARWLAAGVLAAPGLAPLAMASEPVDRPVPNREEPTRTAPRGTSEQDEEATSFTMADDDTARVRPIKGCAPDARFAGLWPKLADVKFHPTTLEERAAFAKLLPALLEAAPETTTPPAGAEKLASSVGFRLEVWEGMQDTFWVLREKPERLRGAGAYVIRTGPATDDVVQVPHPWFDKGTEGIGVGLFACGLKGERPRVFMTATAHRYHGSPGETPEDPEHPADVAHNPDHLFQEVTNQVARTLSAPRVVQLHGFGTAKAESGLRDKSLIAVVSSGTREPTTWARRVSKQLVKLWGEGVRLYPEGTQVLGGTQNAQGRLLQAYEHARFLHLELSAQARGSLSSGERLARLGHVLFAPLED